MFTYSIQIMFPHNNEGRNELLRVYDVETLQQIADTSCADSCSSEHIYTYNAVTFFDKYEGEILDLIHERYGVDTLVELFARDGACYDAYRTSCVFLFIENVAQDVVQSLENEQLSEDQQIEDYMKESISNNGYTLTELNKAADDLLNLSITNGYNPPASMNLNRYSHG